MTGKIIQINLSRGGIPKRPVPEVALTPEGLEGDSWNHPQLHGGPRQAVLIITAETIEELVERGYAVYPGALGENITTRGLDRRQLRLGQRLRVGPTLLEITKIRVPCDTLDPFGGPSIQRELYDKQVKAGDAASPRWGKSGFYCSVIEPGTIRVDDAISIESTLA
jgi:MOSC domain-containing protein YiiM